MIERILSSLKEHGTYSLGESERDLSQNTLQHSDERFLHSQVYGVFAQRMLRQVHMCEDLLVGCIADGT